MRMPSCKLQNSAACHKHLWTLPAAEHTAAELRSCAAPPGVAVPASLFSHNNTDSRTRD